MRRVVRELAREIRALDASRERVRSFALLVGGALVALAVFASWRDGWAADGVVRALAASGGILMVAGVVAASWLTPVYRAWMALALVLGFVMTRVLLTLVFFLALFPMGMVLRLVGKRLIDRTPDPAVESYWRPREAGELDPRRLEEQH